MSDVATFLVAVVAVGLAYFGGRMAGVRAELEKHVECHNNGGTRHHKEQTE